MRSVYPGFLQLSGFMGMNLDRHMVAHYDFFNHLVEGDGDSADKHMEFYDEYLAVMDLTAEFYLQTVDTVFVRHALPKGEMTHHGEPVDPGKITRVALMTVEGEHDDISGVGQTKAAHRLCSALSDAKRQHHLQPGVGHYGVFNGSRFRRDILPRISAFMRAQEDRAARPSPVKSANGVARANGAAKAAPPPQTNDKPRTNGKKPIASDDLTVISGIGPAIAGKLAKLGITSLRQIAELSAKDIARIDAELAFKGRIERENWVGQARKLL
jgi:poly(3-hydroxybutyrate) depolymerase